MSKELAARLVRDLHDRTGEVQSKEVLIRYLQSNTAVCARLTGGVARANRCVRLKNWSLHNECTDDDTGTHRPETHPAAPEGPARRSVLESGDLQDGDRLHPAGRSDSMRWRSAGETRPVFGGRGEAEQQIEQRYPGTGRGRSEECEIRQPRRQSSGEKGELRPVGRGRLPHFAR